MTLIIPAGDCGHSWLAPKKLPTGGWTTERQVCRRPKGHEGRHVSITKVTTERRETSAKGT